MLSDLIASVDLALNASRLSAAEERALTSLTIHESADRSSAVSLVFDNSEPISLGSLLQDPRFQIGAVVAIGLGNPPTRVALADITRVGAHFSSHGHANIILDGYGRRHRLGRTLETHTWQDETASNIAVRIARKHGLTPRCEPTALVHPRVEQFNETDLELLDRLAAAIGFEVWVDCGELWFARPAHSPGVPLVLDGGGFRDLEFTVDTTALVDSAFMAFATRSGLQGVAREDLLGLPLADQTRARWGSHVARLPGLADSLEAAHKAVRARLDRAALDHFILTATVDGRPELRVGTRVDLRGVNPLADGKLVVTAVNHTLTSSEYHTTFTARRYT